MKHRTLITMLLMLLAACQSKTENQSNTSDQNTMKQTAEKSAIEKLLYAYRDASYPD